MNYFTDGYKEHLDFENLKLIGTPSTKLCEYNISDLFAQASSCGYLTQVDRHQLKLAFLGAPLSEEEQAAIDRLLYAVYRGRIRLVDEVATGFPQAPLSQPKPQFRVESCRESPSILLMYSTIEPLPRSHDIDLPRQWCSIAVISEIA
jgi:hypothetical protein